MTLLADTNIPHNKAYAVFQNVNIFLYLQIMKVSLKLLQHTYDHTLILLWYNIMTLNGKSSSSRHGYIGLARCCYISTTEQQNIFIILFVDT